MEVVYFVDNDKLWVAVGWSYECIDDLRMSSDDASQQ